MTSSGSPRKTAFRLARWLIVALAVLLLLPYVLTPLYRIIDPTSTLIVARRVLGKRVERIVVPLDRVAAPLPRSVIASEDAKFCSHHGLDFGEMRAAWREADDLSELRGVSTITQQVAKNLFLWPGRSVVRKVLEFPLALWIDLVLPKRRIMEIYLNIAEWGPNGEFGAEAGPRFPFRRSPRGGNASQAGPAPPPPPHPPPGSP